MSKKGLPFNLKMRHDSHYVDELARSIRSVGRKIQINLLEPNPNQPRTEVGDLTELASSIKLKGVLEPILVKPDSKSGTWMIIAGERRWRAANIAGLAEVPCIELDIDEKDIAEIALIENLQRKDLTIWEEADGFAYLIQKFGYTHEEIAKKIGKSRSTVTESLSIAGLPSNIRTKCLQSNISTKSALLEVARQFDEKAMHDFLEIVNQPQTVNKQSRRNSKTAKKADRKISETSGENFDKTVKIEEFEKNGKTFSYVSSDDAFNLELTFNKAGEFNKIRILAALKEIFNEIKNSNFDSNR